LRRKRTERVQRINVSNLIQDFGRLTRFRGTEIELSQFGSELVDRFTACIGLQLSKRAIGNHFLPQKTCERLKFMREKKAGRLIRKLASSTADVVYWAQRIVTGPGGLLEHVRQAAFG
jgi:capsule polysaccharide export protein KpsC/LpsZ